MTLGKVFIVGAGPGDPGLITVKGMDLLREAEVLIYAGSLVNPALVSASGAAVKLDSWGMSLAELVEAMVSAVRDGKKVVRLHSGDPSLYGAIVEQIRALAEQGVSVEIVPGVSSMFGAAAALGTQLTLRGISDTLIVTRPAGATLEEDQITALSALGTTLVVFLGTEHLEEVLAKLDRPENTPVAVVYHATWPDQIIVRGTILDIAGKAREAGITRTALILIGGVVDPEQTGYQHSVLYS